MATPFRPIAALLVVSVFGTACSGDDDSAVTPIGTRDTSAASSTVVTTDVDTNPEATTTLVATSTMPEGPMTTEEPPFDDEVPAGPKDPRVVWAIDETSEHFGYPRDEISVTSIEPVTWPTTALGCPATGVTYAEVEVPGYRITLTWTDVTIVYHGALDGTPPFRCEFLD